MTKLPSVKLASLCSEIFQAMGYGTRLSYRNELEESHAPLLNSIGYLCGAILGSLSLNFHLLTYVLVYL